MNGKEFEQVCIDRMLIEEKDGRATMGRYGVQGTFIGDKPIDLLPFLDPLDDALSHYDKPKALSLLAQIVEEARKTAGGWMKMESLPDFEGIIAMRGQQFVFDCKVCNEASFPLDKETAKTSRQHKHLRRRSRFGGIAFYLIHFPERVMAKVTEPEQTWAFPVHDDHPLWEQFDRGEVKRINRKHCETYAVPVEWNTSGRGTTLRPDILQAVFTLAESGHVVREVSKPF